MALKLSYKNCKVDYYEPITVTHNNKYKFLSFKRREEDIGLIYIRLPLANVTLRI